MKMLSTTNLYNFSISTTLIFYRSSIQGYLKMLNFKHEKFKCNFCWIDDVKSKSCHLRSCITFFLSFLHLGSLKIQILICEDLRILLCDAHSLQMFFEGCISTPHSIQQICQTFIVLSSSPPKLTKELYIDALTTRMSTNLVVKLAKQQDMGVGRVQFRELQ